VPVPLYDFGALESREPGPTLRLVDRDSDGGGGRGAPDRSCGARVPLNVRSTDPAKFVSPARPEGVGTVQNCVLRREGEVYGRTYLRLDRTWDLHGQSAKAPLTIRTTLHEGGPDTDGRPGGEDFRERDGRLAADRRYRLTRAFGKVVTGLTDWHDRPDEGTYMFETAAMRPRSFNTYRTQSEVTRPVKYAFIGKIPNEFAGWDATPETFFTDDVFAGTTLAWEGGEMKSPPVPNGKLTRVSDDWLKDHGVNPHEAKKDLPGPPKHFDIYKDSIENLFGVRKGRNPKSNYQYVCNLRNC
jgi:hypothetical protein